MSIYDNFGRHALGRNRVPLRQWLAGTAIAVLVAVVLVQCCLHLRVVTYQAEVVGKTYKPSSYSTGTVTDAKGNVSTVQTGEGEKFLLIVRDEASGYVHSESVWGSQWASAEVGQTITLQRLGWVQ